MAIDPLVPTYDSDVPRKRIVDEVLDLLRYRELIRNLVSRNITARYKRSVLGVLWALMDPILTMIVMSVVFTALFHRTIPAFPVFLLSGLVAWNFFSQSSLQAMYDLIRGGRLIGRVNLPLSAFTFASVGTGLVNLLLSLIPLLVLMLVFRIPLTPALLFTPVAVIILTGYPSLESATASIEHDVSAYIRKPFSIEEFREVLVRIAKKKGLVLRKEDELHIAIGRNIRELRKSRALTLKQMSRRTNLSVSLLSQIERAESSASVSSLFKVATALDVKITDLFGDY